MESKDIVKPCLSAVKNFAPLLAAAVANANPLMATALNTASAVLGYFGDFANEKTIDLLQEFKKNEQKILAEVVQSDKFKTAFVKIIGDNITEGNEEKRKLLKNYIVNFACGIELNFNEHTKLITTLNTISLEEFEMLSLWFEGGPISKLPEVKGGMSITIVNIERAARSASPPVQYIFQGSALDFRNRWHNEILMSLGYKGLLFMITENNFGSGQEVKVRGITDFGITFLKFVTKSDEDRVVDLSV
ncbi:MAG: hypothetical protein WC641_02120 [Patescibacteria group bacterium]